MLYFTGCDFSAPGSLDLVGSSLDHYQHCIVKTFTDPGATKEMVNLISKALNGSAILPDFVVVSSLPVIMAEISRVMFPCQPVQAGGGSSPMTSPYYGWDGYDFEVLCLHPDNR